MDRFGKRSIAFAGTSERRDAHPIENLDARQRGRSLVFGVGFEAGIAGVPAFIALTGLWELVFTGFPYMIASKTGSPEAIGASFILFFPFAFLATATLPKEALTGWLDTVATFHNPMTHLLAALRSLLYGGWRFDERQGPSGRQRHRQHRQHPPRPRDPQRPRRARVAPPYAATTGGPAAIGSRSALSS